MKRLPILILLLESSQKLRQEFLHISLHQALTCNPIDMEVVGKAVQLCHEHKDAFATMKLITYLHQNSQSDLAIRDLLYRCFNIVLSVYQSKKSKERTEVLDFIVRQLFKGKSRR